MKLALIAEEEGIAHVQVAERVSRELTSSSEPLGALLGPGGYQRRVLLDFSPATFIDSSGIGWLVVCLKRFREAGGQFVIHSVPPLLLKALTTMQMQRVLELAADEAAARKLLAATPANN